ncbi:hypothetical protein [Roseateles flavus]|uniref:Uncharacterized protein n=1 Tax=Roseateles flavus TaxID=3149041 RepID=A0ABV0GL08_9BURK
MSAQAISRLRLSDCNSLMFAQASGVLSTARRYPSNGPVSDDERKRPLGPPNANDSDQPQSDISARLAIADECLCPPVPIGASASGLSAPRLAERDQVIDS